MLLNFLRKGLTSITPHQRNLKSLAF